MYGDIVYVDRRPTLFRNTKKRENAESRWLDKLIFRTVPYRHYGIEVENGYVIHFSAPNFMNRKKSIISKVPMELFLLDGQKKVLHIGTERLSREETVQRAYSMLGRTEKNYSISNNNCEHFAFWCATGAYHSTQTYLLSKSQTVLMYPVRLSGKVVPMTVMTKNKTVELSLYLYRKILKRA